MLSVACRDGARDKYAITVENIIAAAKQIREEVRKYVIATTICVNLECSLLPSNFSGMPSFLEQFRLYTRCAISGL